jgi:hypothetical protein
VRDIRPDPFVELGLSRQGLKGDFVTEMRALPDML